MITSVKVKLWGHLVGMLAWDAKQHTSYFYFNPMLKKHTEQAEQSKGFKR